MNTTEFYVFNDTDQVPAHPGPLSAEEADQFIKDFPKRFAHQGYYLDGRRQRIDPFDVKLSKHNYQDNPMPFCGCNHEDHHG